jgi:hypothetical protein
MCTCTTHTQYNTQYNSIHTSIHVHNSIHVHIPIEALGGRLYGLEAAQRVALVRRTRTQVYPLGGCQPLRGVQGGVRGGYVSEKGGDRGDRGGMV